jgi:hypothetical protein
MAQKSKATSKRTPARKTAKKPVRKPVGKPVRRPEKTKSPEPTIAGVFELISTRPGFLDHLLTDMNGALEAAHLDLPLADRGVLREMLEATYMVTGAEVLRIFQSWRAIRVAPPPPPWAISTSVFKPVVRS